MLCGWEWHCGFIVSVQSRLEALSQMQQLLSTPRHDSSKMPSSSASDVSKATTLLSSAHHQLLVGCFGFGLLDGTDNISDGQLCHYQVMLIVLRLFLRRILCATNCNLPHLPEIKWLFATIHPWKAKLATCHPTHKRWLLSSKGVRFSLEQPLCVGGYLDARSVCFVPHIVLQLLSWLCCRLTIPVNGAGDSLYLLANTSSVLCCRWM